MSGSYDSADSPKASRQQEVGAQETERARLLADLHRETIRIQERGRTTRTLIVCAAALFGLWLVVDTIQAVASTPPWLQALALFAGSAPASYLLWKMRGRFRVYMSRDHQRTIELEGELDASRTSSGINPDGTSPHGT